MKGFLEAHIPMISGSVILILMIVIHASPSDIPNLGNLLAAVINISAITVGFLVTVVTLLIAIREHPKLSFLSNFKYNNEKSYLVKLIEYIRHAIGYGFLLAIIATGALVFNDKNVSQFFMYYYWAGCSIAGIFISSLWRILKILSLLLGEVINDNK